jgi:hypothetical protein
MSYFDALAAGAFKRDGEGRALFFPWGSIGSGYVIRGEDDRARVHGALVRMHQAAHAAILPLILAPVWLPFALLPPSLLAYAAWVRRVTARRERSPERLSFDESLAIQAGLHRRWVLRLFLALALAFTLGAAHMLATDPEHRLVAAANLVISGAFVVFSWRMLRAARRE